MTASFHPRTLVVVVVVIATLVVAVCRLPTAMTQFGEDTRRHSGVMKKETGHVRGRVSESVAPALPFAYEIRDQEDASRSI